MDHGPIDLNEAAVRLDELVDRAERGETFVITSHGRPVAVLSGWEARREPLDVDAARELVRRLPRQRESAASLVRRMRDHDRY